MRQFLRQLRRSPGDLIGSGCDGRQLCLSLGGTGHLMGLPAAQLLQPRGGGIAAVGAAAHLRKQRRHLLLQRPGRGIDLLHTAGKGLHLLLQGRGAAAALAHLTLHAPDGLGMVRRCGAGHGCGGLMLADGALQRRYAGAPLLGGAVILMHEPGAVLRLGIHLVQLRLGLLLVGPGGLEVRLQFQTVALELLQIFQPHADFQRAQLVVKHQVFFRRFRLLAQRLHLQLQLRDLIVDTHQVLLRALELALGLLLAVAELADARRLLEHLPAVIAADGQDLVNFALTDDGVSLPAHAGIHEQLVDILEPHGLAVDIILRLAAAVITAGHRHLRLVPVEDMLGIVYHQRYLRKAHLPALFRAAEDHILHLGATELAAVLLAHDPADGVGYVGLAGAVGADDGGDVLAEVQDRLIRKRLEALNFQSL